MKILATTMITAVALAFAAWAPVWAASAAVPVTIESRFPGLSAGPLGRAAAGSLPSGVLLSTAGLKLTAKDVSAQIAKSASMKDQLTRYSFFVLEQTATRKLLATEAKAWADKENLSVA